MYKFRSITSLQENPFKLTRQKYYTKNAARMIGQNSAPYRKQTVPERQIPDGLASTASLFSPVSKAKRKTQKEREKKAKPDAKSRAKKTP